MRRTLGTGLLLVALYAVMFAWGASAASASNASVTVGTSQTVATGAAYETDLRGTALGVRWDRVRAVSILVTCSVGNCNAAGVTLNPFVTQGAGSSWYATAIPADSSTSTSNNILGQYSLMGLDGVHLKVSNTSGSSITVSVFLWAEYEPVQANDVLDVSDAATHTALAGTVAVHDAGTQTFTCSSGCSSSGTATLSPDDSTRLDYTWQGTWAIVGLMFVLLIASSWSRAWGWFRGA